MVLIFSYASELPGELVKNSRRPPTQRSRFSKSETGSSNFILDSPASSDCGDWPTASGDTLLEGLGD